MPFSERDISLALISSLGTALAISVLFNSQNNIDGRAYRRSSYRRSSRRKSRHYKEEEERSISNDDLPSKIGYHNYDDDAGDEDSDDYEEVNHDHHFEKNNHRRHHRNPSKKRRSKRGSMDTLEMNNLSGNHESHLPDTGFQTEVHVQSSSNHLRGPMSHKLHNSESTSRPSSSRRRDSDDASLQSNTSEVVSISKNGKTTRRRVSMYSTGSIGSNSDILHQNHRPSSREFVKLTGDGGEIGGIGEVTKGTMSTSTSANDSTLKSITSSMTYKSPIPEKSEGEESSKLDSKSQVDGILVVNNDEHLNEDATLQSTCQSQSHSITQKDSSDTNIDPDDEGEASVGENFQLFIGVDTSDRMFQEFTKMDEILSRSVSSIDQSLALLRRARCVNVMSNKMMIAESETKCFEEVSKLLVSLFKVERSSYTLMVDEEHFTILHCVVTQEKFANQLAFELAETGLKVPLKGTAIGYCAETLEALYTPHAKHSKYIDHQKLMTTGLKSFVNVPILVGERQFAGCLNIGLVAEDPFTELDILLISDIASMLGTHVFSKRLQRSKNESHQISQQLLHSFIPPQVIEKIEHYWAPPSRRIADGTDDFPKSIDLPEESVQSIHRSKKERFSNIKGKLEFLQEYGNDPSRSNNGLKYVSTNEDGDEPPDISNKISQPEGSSPASTSHALYAEDAKGVSIIFCDIVGFSKISLEVPPIMIMDMLQHLFHLYDIICKKHRMMKLETIGDAYLCASGLFENDMDNESSCDKDQSREAALRALAMAKDMVREARRVPVPGTSSTGKTEYLEVRVGIHVGEVTYGVLGQTIPKLVCIGTTVNMAARMEQLSCSSKIRVTQDFHDLVGDEEEGWEAKQIVSVKNMGTVSSWLLDPLK